MARRQMPRRIRIAEDLIAQGAKPKDACFRSGFADYSSFYRAFKARAGLSPERYRRETQRRGAAE